GYKIHIYGIFYHGSFSIIFPIGTGHNFVFANVLLTRPLKFNMPIISFGKDLLLIGLYFIVAGINEQGYTYYEKTYRSHGLVFLAWENSQGNSSGMAKVASQAL